MAKFPVYVGLKKRQRINSKMWGNILMSETFNFFEEKPLENVTISELQGMVRAYSEKRKEKECLAEIMSNKEYEIKELEAKILSVLENHNLENFNVPGFGTVYTSNKFQVSFPKDPAAAELLRQYCLENNLGTELTINHQRLQSLFKAQKEVNEREGNLDMASVLPGVDEPKVYRTIGLRKG